MFMLAKKRVAQAGLGETIRRARQGKRLSQEDLAGLAGITRNFVANVERGDNVSVDVVDRIAAALGLTVLPLGNTKLAVSANTADLNELKRAIESAAVQVERARSLLVNIAAREEVPGSKMPAPVTPLTPGEEAQDVYAGSDLDPRRRR